MVHSSTYIFLHPVLFVTNVLVSYAPCDEEMFFVTTNNLYNNMGHQLQSVYPGQGHPRENRVIRHDSDARPLLGTYAHILPVI